jgi:hypothetical protein
MSHLNFISFENGPANSRQPRVVELLSSEDFYSSLQVQYYICITGQVIILMCASRNSTPYLNAKQRLSRYFMLGRACVYPTNYWSIGSLYGTLANL